MPYPAEHACRLEQPGGFEEGSFRRVHRVGTAAHPGYDVIMAKKKGDSAMSQQAFRYPKGQWTADTARAHCKAHGGLAFEPAGGD